MEDSNLWGENIEEDFKKQLPTSASIGQINIKLGEGDADWYAK
jgi:hypothetical protein